MERFTFILLLTPTLLPAAPPPDPTFFERKIRPILAENCYSCHSQKAKIAFANLRLDTKANITKGSDAGPVITPGNPNSSRLYQSLLYTGTPKMPPTGKLPDAVIADFRQWITDGAPWPDEAPTSSTPAPTKSTTQKHWAWQPVTSPPIPPVRNQGWPATPIDNFILAALEARRLAPNPDAPPLVWLRRVTMDLTGLPPTLTEQEAFEKSPDYAQTVDRLLASPAFGERWGRHWLDQTYFADNIEIGRRVPARHAWRYRDYVIESLNRDVPYNRFLTEQLAGDQLEWTTPVERRRNLTATGLLALGPWPLVNADKEQLRMDVVDLQLDLIGRSMLGLTLGCSRCHDHKFDPITLNDYYGMAGILASARTLSGRLDLGVFSNVNQVILPEEPDELAARAAETRDYWSKLTAVRQNLERLRADRKPLEKDTPEAKALDKQIQAANQLVKLMEFLPPVPPTAHALQEAETPADVAINLRGNAHQLGKVAPRSAIALAGSHKLDIPDFTSGRQELAQWIVRKDNPLTARVAVNRVWHHLLGSGLVTSIDNFGTRGGKPSHPELLDHLATTFAADGWSIKKLVRRIALSRTYRQASTPNAAGQEADPENRLHWRANRKRWEGEILRDAMLAVSGQLDPTRGGPTLPFYVEGNMNVLGKPEFLSDNAKLDPATTRRRSIYLPTLRKGQVEELDILNLFDFPDTNQITGARPATTVPTQALYLMNAAFVKEQARELAKLSLNGEMPDSQRVRSLIRRVYARQPEPGEVDRMLSYIGPDRNPEAWERLCHTLLISNEFLYRR